MRHPALGLWLALLPGLLLGLLMPAATQAQGVTIGPIAPPQGAGNEQNHWIPVYVNGERRSTVLYLRSCQPPGAGKFPLAIVNHGSPPDASRRSTTQPYSCTSALASWFLKRGFALAFPVRRGYGESGGDWAETYGACNSPNYVGGGLQTANDIDAALRYMREQPQVDTGRILVVGQSAGGWGSIAFASRAPEGVWGFANFAGGRGGWADNKPHNNCAPKALIEAAGRFGATARQPMLWVYTENDTFFAPEISQAMYAAFSKAGGRADFHLLPAFGNDGHGLFTSRDGPPVWGPLLERFIASLPQR